MIIAIPQQPSWRAGCYVIQVLAQARFVGGCVRDAVLGRAAADIDIATPLAPAAVLDRLKAAGIRALPTGLAHGTVTALVDGVAIEITTLRRDLACDGRHAEVVFTDDWRADAARRDFTINALSCDAAGTLYDPFGGVADLAAGRVRFVGDAERRIREDVLRLLRFFRFQGRYGSLPPDAPALAACRALAPLLPGLSGERVRGELFRLLADPGCAKVWALMIETGVVAPLLPSATWVGRLAALVVLDSALALPAADLPLPRLAALLAGDEIDCETISARLRLSRAEGQRLAALTAPSPLVAPDAPPEAWCRALVALDDHHRFRDRLLLAAAGRSPPVPAPDLAPALALAARWADTPFPLRGQDLLAHGVAAGPALGRRLADLKLWWAERAFRPDRQACLAELARTS